VREVLQKFKLYFTKLCHSISMRKVWRVRSCSLFWVKQRFKSAVVYRQLIMIDFTVRNSQSNFNFPTKLVIDF